MKYMTIHAFMMQFLAIPFLCAMDDDAKHNPHFAYSRHVIDDHLKTVCEFDSIIDFGCRNGITTHYLYTKTNPKKTSRIVGLDPSVRYIIAAKERQSRHLLAPVTSPAAAPAQQLTRKESFSSSPLEVSTLSTSYPLQVSEPADKDESHDDFSFYQRTLVAKETSNPELDLYTSFIHTQDIDSRDRLEFLVDNLVTISYEGSRAQLVTSFNNLPTFLNKEIFFSNIAKLLKDNGTLLLTTQLESSELKTILDILKTKVTETPWRDLFARFNTEEFYKPLSSMEELKKLLKKYNFNRADIISEERYCTSHHNVSAYLEHEFYAFAPFRFLSVDQKKQLCDSVAQEYMHHYPAENGSIPLPHTVIVKAQRHISSVFSGVGWKH